MKTNNWIIILCLLVTVSGFTQDNNPDFKRVRIGDYKQVASGLDISPDGSRLVMSCVKEFPTSIYDWEKKEVVKEFDVGNWHGGSSVKYSSDGKYLLLNQLYYIDWAPNKDKEVNFEVVDAETGKRVKRFDAYHAVTITPDSKYAVSLTGEEIAFWNLASGKKEKHFKVNKASNGLAISPDNKFIAVSHKFSEDELKSDPRYKKDKKALKDALKYMQKISIYDASSFEFLYTVQEYYDIVYRLEYSDDGKTLFCLQIPHLKAQNNSNARQTYLATIDGVTGEPRRRGFTSQALYEPDFKMSNNGKYLGVVSSGSRFVEVHIYDFKTGKMLKRFEHSYRIMDKNEEGVIVGDNRSALVFLPGDEVVVMTAGNQLVYWTLNIK